MELVIFFWFDRCFWLLFQCYHFITRLSLLLMPIVPNCCHNDCIVLLLYSLRTRIIIAMNITVIKKIILMIHLAIDDVMVVNRIY
jgi:hypothetical protein